jgi:NhaD family Na+/H+ antiporter
MILSTFSIPLILGIFSLGYLGIIFEHYIKINKSGTSLIIAALCWAVFFVSDHINPAQDLIILGHHVSDISQIIFFLLGAMTLVELIDSHKGFQIITDIIRTTSQKKLLWIIATLAFVLSGILDNLTTTILMISLLKKIIPNKDQRVIFSCMVVIAANAGGAWTPIGDVTTTMLWINGQISTIAIMKSLFLPSLVSVLIPLTYFSYTMKGRISVKSVDHKEAPEPGSKIVFYFGLGGLIFVPIFKALTGLPPFMGVLLALGLLWVITDLFHRNYESRNHLKITSILNKIDTASVLFFLGILLSVGALQVAGLLDTVAAWLMNDVKNLPLVAILIGFFSAVVDNVPIVAATMGMYSLEQFPLDSNFWHMIAYTAGTGGSLLIIGSSAGVAMMGMEKMDFVTYAKKASIPGLLGFLGGMGFYLLF